MNLIFRCLLFTLLLCLPGLPALAENAPAAVQLTILHTNDMHSRILPEDDRGNSIGLPEIGAAVKAIRQQSPGTLLVDAGDTLHGMPEINISQGKNMVPLLNAIGYDCMVPGNHDYNYGAEQLQTLAKGLHFPVLSANTIDRHTNQLLFPASTILVRQGLRIAFFGITTPEAAYKTSPNNIKNIQFLDAAAAARRMVKQLRPQADLIIGIMHVGLDKSSVITSDAIARAVPGIDVIIDGHSHTELPHGLYVGNTLIAQTGCYDHHLGRVDIQLQGKRITSKTARLYSPAELQAIAPTPDAGIAQMIVRLKKENQSKFSQVIAYSTQTLSGDRQLIRCQETALGNLTADAMRAAAQADIGLVNSGSIRADLKAGKVTRRDMMAIFPFGNTLKKIAVNGRQLQAVLEHSVQEFPKPSVAFLQVSGLAFVFDPSLPVGQRVTSITVGDAPMEPDKLYTVSVCDFLTAGGDGYSMLKEAKVLGEYGTCEEAMVSWLNQRHAISYQPSGRIQAIASTGKLPKAA